MLPLTRFDASIKSKILAKTLHIGFLLARLALSELFLAFAHAFLSLVLLLRFAPLQYLLFENLSLYLI